MNETDLEKQNAHQEPKTVGVSSSTSPSPSPSRSPSPPTPPQQPKHSIYTKRQKALIVTIASTAATFSGAASNIYFPALPTIADDLHVTPTLVNLTVTSYMIFQGLAPSFWGALSDIKGRRLTYVSTLLVFMAACVGLAETRSYVQLLVLRCLQSTGSASTIAIGSGVIGDITTRAERGGFMGIFQAGLLAPVAIGPIIGGAFAGTLGWRAIFWFLTIYAGVFVIVLFLLLPETLRSLVGDGSIRVDGIARFPLNFYQKSNGVKVQEHVVDTTGSVKSKINILGSLRILISKDVTLIIIFTSIYYSVWQMSITALSTLFKSTYNLNDTSIGLTFIANGVGSMVGTLVTGKLLDIEYRRSKAKAARSGRPFSIVQARLRLSYAWSAMQCISMLVFGWTTDKAVHISVPIIATFFTGWAATSILSTVTTFLVDVYPDRSASASAAVNLARCLMGAGGSAAIMPIINGIGVGWCFTLLVGVMGLATGLVELQVRISRQREKEDDVE